MCHVISYKWSYTLLLKGKYKCINSFLSRGLYVYTLVRFMHYIWVYSIRIKISGDIEMNPSYKPSSCDKFPISHWNLNSISRHNIIKLSLLRGYISIHNFDFLCLSETCLDSIISSNDSNLIIPGHDLYRANQRRIQRMAWGSRTHPFFWNQLFFLQSLWRTTNCKVP